VNQTIRSGSVYTLINKVTAGSFVVGVGRPLLLSVAAVKTLNMSDEKKTELLAEADRLYTETQYEEVYKLLKPHAETDDVEILWRLSRALFQTQKTVSAQAEKLKLTTEAHDLLVKGLTLDPNCFALHKWMAIILDTKSGYEGTKERIKQSFIIKEHMEKAIELNPTDGISRHILGVWCFTVAEMPWYQAKAAAVLFAAPPTSSYEEALEHFLSSEKVDPGGYSMNLLHIGKCYAQLKNKSEAIVYLLRARDYPNKTTDDDMKSEKEAIALLKSLGYKD